jgi:hypothetical protein
MLAPLAPEGLAEIPVIGSGSIERLGHYVLLRKKIPGSTMAVRPSFGRRVNPRFHRFCPRAGNPQVEGRASRRRRDGPSRADVLPARGQRTQTGH